jgi:hypothetical protein
VLGVVRPASADHGAHEVDPRVGQDQTSTP